jgi:hypothetical protein
LASKVYGAGGSGAEVRGGDGSASKVYGAGGSAAEVRGGDGSASNVYGAGGSGANVYGGSGSSPKVYGSGANVYGSGRPAADGPGDNGYGADEPRGEVYGGGSGARGYDVGPESYPSDIAGYGLDGGYDGPGESAGDPAYRARRHRPSANDTNVGTLADFEQFSGWKDERYVQGYGTGRR